jgi:hypothetical protein
MILITVAHQEVLISNEKWYAQYIRSVIYNGGIIK